jgi:hypothetical protein
MFPFILKLPSGRAQCDALTCRTDFSSIECVSAMRCLIRDRSEIEIDCSSRRRMGAKSLQLRVMTITFGRASKHSTREEALSPECDQTLSVKVLGVKCPETHLVAPNDGAERRAVVARQTKLLYLDSSIFLSLNEAMARVRSNVS